ncbi:MAG: protein-tyrosine-phosphatase [Gammaproteobacteria bacterium]|nr:MAG: protein-tyrosine-phosphatase [Gammaproteobacteria bacterium]TND06848.1 MAG: protein-tyrosine-phosphatase [Gammaproteobacteria bacterium]
MEKLLAHEGVADRVMVDSAGTHDYHIGKPPDARAQAVARKRGMDISRQRARQADRDDFEQFDYVLAMDRDNLELLRAICPRGSEGRLRLFLEFAPQLERTDVPDPYWGGPDGFERVLDMIEAAAGGLLADIRQRHLNN